MQENNANKGSSVIAFIMGAIASGALTFRFRAESVDLITRSNGVVVTLAEGLSLTDLSPADHQILSHCHQLNVERDAAISNQIQKFELENPPVREKPALRIVQ